jgi:hypothetical protein
MTRSTVTLDDWLAYATGLLHTPARCGRTCSRWPAGRAAILVVDLEATCADDDPAFDMETIEIGACWIGADGSVLDRFQSCHGFIRICVNAVRSRSQ